MHTSRNTFLNRPWAIVTVVLMALYVITIAMTPITQTKLTFLALVPLCAATLLYAADRRVAAIIVFLIGWLLIGLAVMDVAFGRYPEDWQEQEFADAVKWGWVFFNGLALFPAIAAMIDLVGLRNRPRAPRILTSHIAPPDPGDQADRI